METLKDAGRFCLGLLFVVTCIPPLLMIGAIWICGGSDREST
jgi:hypothetical protein